MVQILTLLRPMNCTVSFLYTRFRNIFGVPLIIVLSIYLFNSTYILKAIKTRNICFYLTINLDSNSPAGMKPQKLLFSYRLESTIYLLFCLP